MKRESSIESLKVKKRKLPQGQLFDPLDKRFDLNEISLADGSSSVMQRMINIEDQFMDFVQKGQVDEKQVE